MEQEIALVDIFKSIFRHIVLVVLIPAIAVAITAYLCWNVIPKTYTAETSMYVLTKSDSDTLSYNEINISTQLVSDYREMAESKRVKSGACQMVGISEKEFAEYSIAVDTTNSTRLIKLSVTGKNPATVANLANAFAAKLSDCILDVANVENISIIDEAAPPEGPSGPESIKYTAIAGIGGLVLSILLAIFIDTSNVSIKTREDVERYLQLPVLAQIPLETKQRGGEKYYGK